LSIRALSLLCLLGALSLSAQAPPVPVKGVGDLAVVPHRVVFQGRDRAAEVMLRNDGSAPATYRVLIKEMVMLPSGQLEDRTKAPGELTAADLVRMTPRQVELKPGEVQMVRFQLRKPAELADGEYRSHVLFQAVPAADLPEPETAAGDKGLSFKLTPIFGITIPIIVRHGNLKAQLGIKNAVARIPDKDDGPWTLAFSLERQGSSSVLGDVLVQVEKGGRLKRGEILTQMKGIGIYTGLDTRDVRLPLAPAKREALKGTQLRITFTPTDGNAALVTALVDVAG
jgi:P pilus assembly chaperone PapD